MIPIRFAPASIARWALGLTMLALASGTASAQGVHIGPRVGYDFESKDVFFSTQLTVPITSRLEFYPSVDFYTPDQGRLNGFNGDLKFRMPVSSGTEFYTGGGVNILSRSLRGESETDIGGNILLGLESRIGLVHPFAEGRLRLQERGSAQAVVGVNFSLGR